MPSTMRLPVVAIVGRPNVGKSSLFNALVGRRISIVEPTPGVTRDRVSAVCDADDVYFELVDTGGYGIVDRDDLTEQVERQIRIAVEQARLILFVVDARAGLTPLDRRTAELLRQHTEHTWLIANKVDEPHMIEHLADFHRLGYGEPMPVSALSGHGRADLLSSIVDEVRNAERIVPGDPALKLAIVGKRNAGKSTFINALVGEPRVIVSETPGTTRDSIDVHVSRDGRTIVAIDTAGIRKKSRIADEIEFYAYARMTSSIERADVVLFLIDATVPIGQVDKALAKLIADRLKPCVLVINKWDLARNRASTVDFGEYLLKALPGLSYAPVAFTSAVRARNVASAVDVACSLHRQACTRTNTGRLNQVLQASLAYHAPRPRRGRKPPRIYYATQIGTHPPTIVLFVNDPKAITRDYERFLMNRFREHLPFAEIPIRLLFRPRRALVGGR